MEKLCTLCVSVLPELGVRWGPMDPWNWNWWAPGSVRESASKNEVEKRLRKAPKADLWPPRACKWAWAYVGPHRCTHMNMYTHTHRSDAYMYRQDQKSVPRWQIIQVLWEEQLYKEENTSKGICRLSKRWRCYQWVTVGCPVFCEDAASHKSTLSKPVK